jgi:hypothetical protein
MLAIVVENKKESLLYTIALGCIFLLIIGVTWLYWANPSNHPSTSLAAPTSPAASPAEYAASPSRYQEKTSESSTVWFFGTLIVFLLLLFGLTFRYYSHREIKEAENRWRTACECFLTRMEIERMATEEEQVNNGRAWSVIVLKMNGSRHRSTGMQTMSVQT